MKEKRKMEAKFVSQWQTTFALKRRRTKLLEGKEEKYSSRENRPYVHLTHVQQTEKERKKEKKRKKESKEKERRKIKRERKIEATKEISFTSYFIR